MNHILETKSLFHDFSGWEVLFDVNLEVREGERHAIIGPNGAGKTTLFNVITGMYKPSRGAVYFKGKDVTGLGPYALSRLGMGRSFQITSTFERQTVFQNIRMGVLSRKGIRFNMFRKVDGLEDVTRETEEILKRINLDKERDYPASILSYGKHRSLEVSMAMATDPDLVMLDEPTAGMSKDETKYAVELIRRLTEGKTMVIIEHDMDVVFSIADRITVLHLGTILASGPPEEIREDQRVKDAYLGEMEE
ncbi:MAG: ABC transporter ATP-binding protein [Deltaproteobacteria bacterium]|nr:ABC transporter ATP-binding protein [Deltaproteobacteria bacterium]MBW1950808.1 ABC transporter ATP-binding protein [Deltaproteobacteria bacterium]MBW2009378.1 ABC transporter ATP-binding protein [Deltaproteobacteria bacterium]MBW2347412.1 ABC transporter ATP-binding protein [Deltaproteobacteria bacterium]